jgi:hypothetical protein
MTPTINEVKGHVRRRDSESGMALVLALVSLLLLTFLGLTLAASTSTELQIAANYRWSQMALYNALAGLDAARSAMAEVDNWADLVPRRTGVSWDPTTMTGDATKADLGLAIESTGTRSHEEYYCDTYGNGMGYGVILAPAGATDSFENATSYLTQPIPGAFTVWVRRPVRLNGLGQLEDVEDADALVVTSEGVAPAQAVTSTQALHRAVRFVEATFYSGTPHHGQGCGDRVGQVGGGAAGASMASCPTLGGERKGHR